LKWGVSMKVAADFRKEAREALQGKWKMAVLAALVAILLGATGNGFDIEFERTADSAVFGLEFGRTRIFTRGVGTADTAYIESFVTGAVLYLVIISLVLTVIYFLIGSIVMVGYAKYNLDLVDGEEGNIGTLFDYFPQWKTMAAAGFLQFVIVGLGFLLFIIPGIVLGLCYAMTPYILAEEPELKAWEAMKRSKELMNGNKWRFFCLGFSFIGWEILASLVPAIGQLFLLPYINASYGAFYRDITQHPVDMGEEQAAYLQETILGE